MKLTLKKAAVATTLAGALLIAAPVAAHADPYATPGPNTVVQEITEDGPAATGGFAAGTPVTFTLSGVGVTGANIATAGARVTSASVTKTADASGSATVNITLPEPQIGSYLLAATGTRADGTVGTDVSVVGGGSGSAGGSTGATGTTNASGSNSLPATGMDANSLLGFWVGGGALVLAGATVAVATTVRRNRQGTKA